MSNYSTISLLARLHCVLLLKEGLVDWAFDFYKMTSHPSRWALSPHLLLPHYVSLSPPKAFSSLPLFPWPYSMLTCSFSAPLTLCPLPPVTLSQDEKRSVWESAERKNRRVNRGERSRAFYTRYKYLQKCGWNTWNTHEGKKRGENIAAVESFAHMHMRPTCKQALIHKSTKYFLNLSLLMAFRLAEWCSERKDHPSTKGLLVQTLMSETICPAVVSLSTVSNPSSSCWPYASNKELPMCISLQLQWLLLEEAEYHLRGAHVNSG